MCESIRSGVFQLVNGRDDFFNEFLDWSSSVYCLLHFFSEFLPFLCVLFTYPEFDTLVNLYSFRFINNDYTNIFNSFIILLITFSCICNNHCH